MAKQRSNSAKQKLGQEPFRTVTEKKEFVDKIKRDVLTRLETAKAMEEFTNKQEYQFFKERFRKGVSCKYGPDINDIIHVSLYDEGIKVTISESAKKTEYPNELELINQLVKSVSESLIVSYFEAMGYLPKDNDHDLRFKPSSILNT